MLVLLSLLTVSTATAQLMDGVQFDTMGIIFNGPPRDCSQGAEQFIDFSGIVIENSENYSIIMNGDIQVLQELAGPIQATAAVIKNDVESETELRNEEDICPRLSEKNQIWSQIFSSIGVESCPIPAGTYTVQNEESNLGELQKWRYFLTENDSGKYTVRNRLINGADGSELACVEVDAEIKLKSLM